MKKKHFLYSLFCFFQPALCYSRLADTEPKDLLAKFHLKLRAMPALRVAHDLKSRQKISSIELMTRCAIAGTESNFKIEDGLGPDKSARMVEGKIIEWSDRLEKASAEYILKVILDTNAWMITFSDNSIIIHRYRV
jgi:hypothetical protein